MAVLFAAFVFVCVPSLCLAQSDLVIPTTYGASNRPRIVVNLVNLDNRVQILENVMMGINTWRTTRPMTSGDYGFSVAASSGESIVLHGTHHANQIPYDTEICIGYGSEFFALVGSVMVIPPTRRDQNQGSLILNPTNVSTQYCFEGLINYIEIDPTHPTVDATFEITRVQGTSFVHQSFDQSAVLEYQLEAEHEYISLPSGAIIDLMNEISRSTSIMPQHPLYGARRTWIIPAGQCTVETISRMPNLKFKIRDYQQQTAVVEIHLEPRDYLRVDTTVDGCEILLVSDSTPKLGAPFLRLVAVHFDTNRIGFCEPI